MHYIQGRKGDSPRELTKHEQMELSKMQVTINECLDNGAYLCSYGAPTGQLHFNQIRVLEFIRRADIIDPACKVTKALRTLMKHATEQQSNPALREDSSTRLVDPQLRELLATKILGPLREELITILMDPLREVLATKPGDLLSEQLATRLGGPWLEQLTSSPLRRHLPTILGDSLQQPLASRN